MPVSVPLTADDVRTLISRNQALRRTMGDVAIAAATMATALASRGAPPSEALVQDLAEVGRMFTALRADSCAAASALGLPLPPLDTVNSATDIEAMLGALLTSVAAAERQAAIAAARRSALGVLDRVGLLTYVDHRDFEPLKSCQEKAGRARAVVEQQTTEPDASVMTPFAALLELMESHQNLDDQRFGALQDIVTAEFGAALATAAGRGRLNHGSPAQA